MVYKILKSLLVLSLFIPIFIWINELSHINIAQAEHYMDKEIDIVQDEIKARYEAIENKSSKDDLKGIDLSHNNGKVLWQEINGVDFVIIKSTGGDTFVDPMFKHNWDGARSVGLKRGVYHFYYASDDPITQSKNFLDTIGTLKKFDLPPVVDVEILDHGDKELLLYGLTRFLEIVEKKTKKRPIIYSGLDFYKSYLNEDKLKKYPIWIADYARSDIKELQKELPNRDIVMWQYTQKAQIKGLDGFVDKSIFFKDIASFLKD